jgi:hypothetical protein
MGETGGGTAFFPDRPANEEKNDNGLDEMGGEGFATEISVCGAFCPSSDFLSSPASELSFASGAADGLLSTDGKYREFGAEGDDNALRSSEDRELSTGMDASSDDDV